MRHYDQFEPTLLKAIICTHKFGIVPAAGSCNISRIASSLAKSIIMPPGSPSVKSSAVVCWSAIVICVVTLFGRWRALDELYSMGLLT